jgi:hypothetical protein
VVRNGGVRKSAKQRKLKGEGRERNLAEYHTIIFSLHQIGHGHLRGESSRSEYDTCIRIRGREREREGEGGRSTKVKSGDH